MHSLLGIHIVISNNYKNTRLNGTHILSRLTGDICMYVCMYVGVLFLFNGTYRKIHINLTIIIMLSRKP